VLVWLPAFTLLRVSVYELCTADGLWGMAN